MLPIAPDGSKRPTVPWKRDQAARVEEATVATWFHHGKGLAIIAGAVSGGLEVLAFDAPELFAPWSALVEALCPGLLARLPVVQTPSDGRHVYDRCLTIRGNHTLAQRLTVEGRPETVIETRGEGGYVIIPPSPPPVIPCSGPTCSYRAISPRCRRLTPEERTTVLDAARTFNTYLPPERIVTGSPDASQRPGPGIAGPRPGDHYNAQAAWPTLLEAYGWQRVGQRGEVTLWRRPGKTTPGGGATTNYAGSNLLHVFSTHAHPFELEPAYTLFATYALLAHEGDFTASLLEQNPRGLAFIQDELTGRVLAMTQ